MAKRASKTGRPSISSDETVQIGVVVTKPEKERMLAIASRDGRSLSNWARLALLVALQSEESREPDSKR